MSIKHDRQNKRVFVAVSGGVDSSVALALLQKRGYDVTGCFMKNWSRTYPGLSCNWAGDRQDAMRVCAALNVPFCTVDLERTYVGRVFKNFIAEYRAGRTPNPDVLCNSEVKFGAFLSWALANGADAIATGHYARVQRSKDIFTLLAGRDKNKDQSYFLYRLGQRELSRTLFPVGGLIKPQVRAMAKKFGLPTAEKKDSQGVCFMGEVALRQFLRRWIPERPGNIVRLPEKCHLLTCANEQTCSARVVGGHPGVRYFTVGQRHGLGVQGGGTPLYVAAKDVKRNILYVAPKAHPALFAKEAVLRNVRWVSGAAPRFPLHCAARIRYRQPLQSCRIVKSNIKHQTSKIMKVIFKKAQWAPASGQSVVFYKGCEVLGGGIID